MFFDQLRRIDVDMGYLGPTVAANEVEISAGEDRRGGDLEADRAFQLLLLRLDLAVDELEKLQVQLGLPFAFVFWRLGSELGFEGFHFLFEQGDFLFGLKHTVFNVAFKIPFLLDQFDHCFVFLLDLADKTLVFSLQV